LIVGPLKLRLRASDEEQHLKLCGLFFEKLFLTLRLSFEFCSIDNLEDGNHGVVMPARLFSGEFDEEERVGRFGSFAG
jgi:hypothetical protein